ncbi:transcriptional regulator [Candidatus Poribacteria bacterium]|nr:transcriptional regulator [Candidatus Poribacteria bacterium]MYB66242.1 transcriptional regulator [Candidatus Poribacteria bacterium]
MFHSVTELIEKIILGEDTTIEFKRVMPHRDSLADEIAAFANAQGGTILIGIDDNKEIVGLEQQELDRVEKMVVEICTDSIKPAVDFFTEKLRIDDKNILKTEVPRSLFVHRSPNGYFTRRGSSKIELPPDQLARLMQRRSQARIIRFDEQLVPNTHKGTLRESHYRRFIKEDVSEEDIEDLLLKRTLLVQEGREIRASVAGVLMCHDTPDDYLYNSFIQAVYYSSKVKDANYQIDAKDFRGPLDQQIIDAYQFVQKHNKVSARKEVGRIDQPQYSMRAIFEAIVNAVVHRDYSKGESKIRLFMFADRLELYSPGALANTVTIEKLPYSQATRNELLARLLSEITLDEVVENQVKRRHFLDGRGEGVGIILNESEELSGKTPLYELHNEELCLTIFAAESL